MTDMWFWGIMRRAGCRYNCPEKQVSTKLSTKVSTKLSTKFRIIGKNSGLYRIKKQ